LRSADPDATAAIVGALPNILPLLVLVAAHPEVEQGLGLFDRLEYDRAVVVLGRALTREDLSREERVTALETLAFAYAILGDHVNAERAFHRLLDLAPEHRVGGNRSPRLREAFEAAKTSWETGRRIELVVEPDPDRVVVNLGAGDPARVGSVVLAEKTRTPLSCTGRICRGARPDASFSVEVLDHQGAILASAGPFEGKPALHLPWWAWALIGAGAIAGGAAIGATLARDRDAPEGSLGRTRLP